MPVQHRAGELRDLYKAQDYSGMVKWIRDSMGLDLRVKLGLVNKGGQRRQRGLKRFSPCPELTLLNLEAHW